MKKISLFVGLMILAQMALADNICQEAPQCSLENPLKIYGEYKFVSTQSGDCFGFNTSEDDLLVVETLAHDCNDVNVSKVSKKHGYDHILSGEIPGIAISTENLSNLASDKTVLRVNDNSLVYKNYRSKNRICIEDEQDQLIHTWDSTSLKLKGDMLYAKFEKDAVSAPNIKSECVFQKIKPGQNSLSEIPK